MDFEYELKKPYLLYRNAAQEVNGIWFYNPEECEEVANLFNRYHNFCYSSYLCYVSSCLFMLANFSFRDASSYPIWMADCVGACVRACVRVCVCVCWLVCNVSSVIEEDA